MLDGVAVPDPHRSTEHPTHWLISTQVDAALGSANPAEVLVKKAFDAGSDDNITAAVIIFEKDETVV